MRKTKEEAEVTRRNLLKAALVVFSRQGYADTRLEDIAAEANVTRGAIYHHFGSKAELYMMLVGEASARINPVIEQVVAESDGPLDTLRQLLVSLLRFAVEDEDFRAVSEITIFKTAITPELEDGMKLKLEGSRALVDFLTQLVGEGINAGEIRPDIIARDAAVGLLAFYTGLLTTWLLDQTLFSLKERADAIADIYIRGLAAS